MPHRSGTISAMLYSQRIVNNSINFKIISRVQSFVNRENGPRRNMNGAGQGGRLVGRRTAGNTQVINGMQQIGNRNARQQDLNAAFSAGDRNKAGTGRLVRSGRNAGQFRPIQNPARRSEV